jgi:hypothetical protein
MSEPENSPAPGSEAADGHEARGEAQPAETPPAEPAGNRETAGDAPAEHATPLDPDRRPDSSGPDEQPAQAPPHHEAQPPVQRDGHPTPPDPARHAPPHHEAQPPVQQGVLVTAPQHPYAQQRQHQYYQQMAAQRPRTVLPNPRWHRPELSATQTAILLAGAVALFGAWSAFPNDGVGIGMSLFGIAMVAVPLAMSGEDVRSRLPGAVLVAALWSVAAIRDAGWVVALCTLAAFVLTPLALAPQHRIGGTLVAVCFGWLEGLAESFKWAGRGRRSADGANPGTVRMAWTAGVTVVLLLVFGGLFAAADSTFADLAARLLPDLDPVEVFLRLMLAVILFAVVLVWTYAAVVRPRWDGEEERGHRTVSRFELAVPLGALNLLFAVFIAVQLRVYFGGEEYVMKTSGLTFAEYARRGFWELSAVAVLVLAVIAIAAWLAPKRAKADRWTARVMLGLLALMSMAVVASAAYRMYTYTETFGLTRMRVWIFTVEFWLAVLFALVLVGCWKLRANWLPRAVLASGALTLLGLAAANPDALIARYNIDHDHKLDRYYLQQLSDDAVPEFAGLDDEDYACMLDGRWDSDDQDLMSWNLGYQRARGFLDDHPEGDSESCLQPSFDAYETEPDESRGGEDWGDEDRSGENGGESAEAWVPSGDLGPFWHWDTCARYDLGPVTELFGTSASGDRGVVSDDPSQYAEELDPALGQGNAVLHCGYYGPGTRYLMIETYDWGTLDAAVAGAASMRAADEADGFSAVTDIAEIDAEATAGYVAVVEGEVYQYTEVMENLVVVVTLSDSATDASARPICDDLASQSYAFFSEPA